VRGPKRNEPVEADRRFYAFLTTEANGVVDPVHPTAMPVLLTTPEEGRT
jgi:putative SOS response-associated peptidase YedK